MSHDIQNLRELVSGWELRARSDAVFLVGIDGCGGSGKSSLAQRITAIHPAVSVVHHDDFYLPSALRPAPTGSTFGTSFDWRRLEEQVLRRLAAREPSRYQRYCWDTDRLTDWVTVEAAGVVVIEGVYCTRSELADYYDFRVWVETPREARLARGVARDGESSRATWTDEWMPAEDRYLRLDRPDARAHLVIDGSGQVPCDPAVEYVRRPEAGGPPAT